jgi:hypothetical protein
MNRLNPVSCGARCQLLALLVLACFLAVGSPSQAQPARSTFPGRRIGGGTRGECTSRLLVHLVPANSVYASGQPHLLGLLQGPALEPMPLDLSFRSYRPDGRSEPVEPRSASPPPAVLMPAPAGVTLLRLDSLKGPTVWSSHYRCSLTPNNDDPLDFVVTTTPPAVSLLLLQQDTTAADRRVGQALEQLRQRCGGTVARKELARAFGLEDLMAEGWPVQLPVRCL